MEDYSRFSYSNLLKFFQVEDRYDSEGVNYADYLLSMGDAKSIDDDVEADKGVTRCLPHVILPKKRINQLK